MFQKYGFRCIDDAPAPPLQSIGVSVGGRIGRARNFGLGIHRGTIIDVNRLVVKSFGCVTPIDTSSVQMTSQDE